MLKIGDLARAAAVSVDTVRFYERRGLLPVADRRPSGYRIYADATAERIGFIKSLQALGFTLDEIAACLKEIDAGEMDREKGRRHIGAVLDRVEGRIAELMNVRDDIHAVMSECRAGLCRFSRPALCDVFGTG